MASPTKTIRLSPDLTKICDKRAKSLGYPNASDYIRGLIRYDSMVGGSHSVTLPIAQLSLDAQDRIDAKLLANLIAGVTERGEFFKRLIAQMDEPPTSEGIVKQIAEAKS